MTVVPRSAARARLESALYLVGRYADKAYQAAEVLGDTGMCEDLALLKRECVRLLDASLRGKRPKQDLSRQTTIYDAGIRDEPASA